MISHAPGTKVFLACRPIDLRNGFDGLAAKAQQMIGADPFTGHLFLFRSKRGDYLTALYWDGSGLCLFTKRREIRVVLDNLSTHTVGALYETFPAPEAHRIVQRIEFHNTPKHASWLNMVEIEIGVLRGQCLDRRIGDWKRLVYEIKAWQNQRNAARARINWKFTTEKARDKLARAYPDTSKES